MCHVVKFNVKAEDAPAEDLQSPTTDKQRAKGLGIQLTAMINPSSKAREFLGTSTLHLDC